MTKNKKYPESFSAPTPTEYHKRLISTVSFSMVRFFCLHRLQFTTFFTLCWPFLCLCVAPDYEYCIWVCYVKNYIESILWFNTISENTLISLILLSSGRDIELCFNLFAIYSITLSVTQILNASVLNGKHEEGSGRGLIWRTTLTYVWGRNWGKPHTHLRKMWSIRAEIWPPTSRTECCSVVILVLHKLIMHARKQGQLCTGAEKGNSVPNRY